LEEEIIRLEGPWRHLTNGLKEALGLLPLGGGLPDWAPYLGFYVTGLFPGGIFHFGGTWKG